MDSKLFYSQLADVYDSLFFALGKDYYQEAEKIHHLIKEYKLSIGTSLLDLGCGTGEHIRYLKKYYQVTGIDNSEGMLAEAERKNPEIRFRQMDMIDFQLEERFDVITCLFGAIGYLATKENLHKAVANISKHLVDGGIFIVEPWFDPDTIHEQHKQVEFAERDGISICRMQELCIQDDISKLTGYVLIYKNNHVYCYVSQHVFGLFSKETFMNVFSAANLGCVSSKNNLSGRGLYVARKI